MKRSLLKMCSIVACVGFSAGCGNNNKDEGGRNEQTIDKVADDFSSKIHKFAGEVNCKSKDLIDYYYSVYLKKKDVKKDYVEPLEIIKNKVLRLFDDGKNAIENHKDYNKYSSKNLLDDYQRLRKNFDDSFNELHLEYSKIPDIGIEGGDLQKFVEKMRDDCRALDNFFDNIRMATENYS